MMLPYISNFSFLPHMKLKKKPNQKTERIINLSFKEYKINPKYKF